MKSGEQEGHIPREQEGHIPRAISQCLCGVQDVVIHVRPEDSVSEGEI